MNSKWLCKIIPSYLASLAYMRHMILLRKESLNHIFKFFISYSAVDQIQKNVHVR